MNKKKGSINISLGNELNAQIVIGKNSCELQVILDLFCLGEIKQFPVKMFLSRKNQNLIGDFGNGGFFNYDVVFEHNVFQEQSSATNLISIKDKFNNKSNFYNIGSNPNIYLGINGDKKIEYILNSSKTIYAISDSKDNIFKYEYNNNSLNREFTFKNSVRYTISNTSINTSMDGTLIYHKPKAEFIRNNNLITSIEYYKTLYDSSSPTNLSEIIEFQYSSNKLSKVIFRYLNGLTSTYEFVLNSNEWTIKHVESNKYLLFAFSDSTNLLYFKEDFIGEVNTKYENDVYYGADYVVICSLNNFRYFHFDKNDNIDFETDDLGVFKSFKSTKYFYDYKVSKESNTFLFSSTNVAQNNLLISDFNTQDISGWSVVPCAVSPVFQVENAAKPQYFQKMCSEYATRLEVSPAVSDSIIKTVINGNFTNKTYIFGGLIETISIYEENTCTLNIKTYFNNNILTNELHDVSLNQNGSFNHFLEGISFKCEVDKIEISLIFYRGTKVRLRAFKLIEADYGKTYEYDSSFLPSKIFDNKSITRIKNHSGHISRLEFSNLNSKLNDEKIEGDKIIKTIKTSAYLENKKIFAKVGKMLLSEENIYSKGGSTLKQKTEFEYYGKTLIKSVSKSCETPINFSYNLNTNLISSASQGSYSKNNTYNDLRTDIRLLYNGAAFFNSRTNFLSKGNVSSINDNYINTSFLYNSKNHVTNTLYNNKYIEQYSYTNANLSATSLVKTISLNNSSSVYNINYDNYDEVSTIVASSSFLYRFIYNGEKQIAAIHNIDAQLNYYFTYDFFKNIKSMSSGIYSLSNIIEDNSLIYSTINAFDSINTFSFKQKCENNNNSICGRIIAELQDQNYYVCLLYDSYFPFEDENDKAKYLRLARNFYTEEDYINPVSNDIEAQSIKMKSGSSLNYLELHSPYDLSYVKEINKLFNEGTVSFLFKITSEILNCSVVTIRLNDFYIEFCSKLNTSSHICEYVLASYFLDEDNDLFDYQERKFNTEVTKDALNSLIFNYSNEPDMTYCEVILNNERKQFNIPSFDHNGLVRKEYILNCKTHIIKNDYATKEIYGLIADFEDKIPFKKAMLNIDRNKKLYYLAELYEDNSAFIPSIDSTTNYFDINNYFHWFSFENSLISNKGDKPLTYVDKNNCFVFDSMHFGNSYYSYKNRLIYQTDINKRGFIFSKIKIMNSNEDNLYFALDNSIYKYKLLRTKDNKFVFKINDGVIFSINDTRRANDLLKEHTFLFSFEVLSTFEIKVIFYLNDLIIFNEIVNVNFIINNDCQNMKLYVGCDDTQYNFTNIFNEYCTIYTSNCNAIYSDLIYRNVLINDAQYSQILKFTNTLNTNGLYDCFGRIDQSKLINDNKMKINKKYMYLNDGVLQSNRCNTEKILFNAINDDFSNALNRQIHYFYDDNKMINQYRFEYNPAHALQSINSIFTYNNKGTIQKEIIYNGPQGAHNNLDNTRLVYDYEYSSDGSNNLSKITKIKYVNGVPNNEITQFTYDNNNPALLKTAGSKIINYNNLYMSSIIDSSTGKTTTLNFFGRKLKSIQKNGEFNLDFKYDCYGRRVKKINNLTGKTTRFIYDLEGKLVVQDDGTTRIEFIYDFSNRPISFIVENLATRIKTKYYYLTDMMGNILEILDENMNMKCRYYYDAFGNTVYFEGIQAISNLNPFRYRGYYYDIETQLYWASSRYYSPELCRWISPDSIEYLDPKSINGLNLYAYCGNDPINKCDPTGHSAIALLIAFGIGAVLGGIYGGVSAAANGQNALAGIVIGAVVGGVTGLITEVASVPLMLLGTFAVGAGGDIAYQMILDGKSFVEVNLVSAAWAGVANAGLALVGKGLSIVDKIAGLTTAESIIFGTMTNSPLLGLGMVINMGISKHASVYTINDLYNETIGKYKQLTWRW